MHITSSQVNQFQETGYLLIEHVFTQSEVNSMLDEMQRIITIDSPRRILEKNGYVRSVFAPETDSRLFEKVTRLERLVKPAMALLGSEVYIHQTKLNTKFAMAGDWWEWHQDYVFWKNDDGMRFPQVLTIMIFLNDINEFNGPMLLIPGSHKAGVVDDGENKNGHEEVNSWYTQYQKSADYLPALTSNLKYTLKQHTIMKWAKSNGLTAAKGAAGAILFFHGNIFHASSNNLSPWDRHTLLITYNSMQNTLSPVAKPRPEFLANRNPVPLTAEDNLF